VVVLLQHRTVSSISLRMSWKASAGETGKYVANLIAQIAAWFLLARIPATIRESTVKACIRRLIVADIIKK